MPLNKTIRLRQNLLGLLTKDEIGKLAICGKYQPREAESDISAKLKQLDNKE